MADPESGQVDPKYWEGIISQLVQCSPSDLLDKILLKWRSTKLESLVGITGRPPKDWIYELFTQANKQSWLSLLLIRVQSWTQHPGLRTEIGIALGDFGSARPGWYDVPVAIGRAVIDRSQFRSTLFEFLERDSANIRLLVVRGDNPGKSHCRWLAQYVANQIGMTTLYIDLLQDASRLRSDLANRLSLHYAEFMEGFTTSARDSKEFVGWLAGKLNNAPLLNSRYLLIFDHIAKPGVPVEAREVVIELARKAVNQELTNIWVILIDTEGLGEIEHPGASSEELVPQVTRHEVNNFLEFAWRFRGGIGHTPRNVPVALTEMLDGSIVALSKENLKKAEREIAQWMRNIT